MNDGQGDAEKTIRPMARNSPWASMGSDGVAAAQTLEADLQSAIAAGRDYVQTIVRLNKLTPENIYDLMQDVKLCADRNGFFLNEVEASIAAFEKWKELKNKIGMIFRPSVELRLRSLPLNYPITWPETDDEPALSIRTHYAIEDDLEIRFYLTQKNLYKRRALRRLYIELITKLCILLMIFSGITYRFYFWEPNKPHRRQDVTVRSTRMLPRDWIDLTPQKSDQDSLWDRHDSRDHREPFVYKRDPRAFE